MAAPSPIITPVSTGRPRAHAQSAPAASITASRSQLTSPLSTSAGLTANATASQGRPGLTPARNHAASIAISPSPTALTATKIRRSRCTSSRLPRPSTEVS